MKKRRARNKKLTLTASYVTLVPCNVLAWENLILPNRVACQPCIQRFSGILSEKQLSEIRKAKYQ